MRCHACKQEIEQRRPDGCCPLCGATAGPAHREIMQIYIITGAFFASVLVYGGIVAFLETTNFTPVRAAPQLPYSLLVLAAALLGAMLAAERQLLARKTTAGARAAALVTAALCETIALFGLVAYVLGGGMGWVVVFLGLALAGFVYLSSRLPVYVRTIEENEEQR